MGPYKPMGAGDVVEDAYEDAKQAAEALGGYVPKSNPFIFVMARNGRYHVAGDPSLPGYAEMVATGKLRLASGTMQPGVVKLFHRASGTLVGVLAVVTRSPRPDIEEHLAQQGAFRVLSCPRPLKF